MELNDHGTKLVQTTGERLAGYMHELIAAQASLKGTSTPSQKSL